MTTGQTAERRLTAYLDNEASRNVIHSPEEAKRLGYEGGLVTGVVVFGWAVPAVLEVLGDGWLSHGWTDYRFRRPVYEGDEVHAQIHELEPGMADVEIMRQGEERCVVGGVGLGTASWFEEIEDTGGLRPAEDAPESKPRLVEVADVPVGELIRPRAVPVSLEEAGTLADRVRDQDPRWRGTGALVHPHFVGSQMYQLLLHSYDQYPSMHYHSRIQQLAPITAGQTLTVTGRFVDATERNANRFLTIAGAIFGEDGAELFRIRYQTVFHITGR